VLPAAIVAGMIGILLFGSGGGSEDPEPDPVGFHEDDPQQTTTQAKEPTETQPTGDEKPPDKKPPGLPYQVPPPPRPSSTSNHPPVIAHELRPHGTVFGDDQLNPLDD
jgi:hypothetical protein